MPGGWVAAWRRFVARVGGGVGWFVAAGQGAYRGGCRGLVLEADGRRGPGGVGLLPLPTPGQFPAFAEVLVEHGEAEDKVLDVVWL